MHEKGFFKVLKIYLVFKNFKKVGFFFLRVLRIRKSLGQK